MSDFLRKLLDKRGIDPEAMGKNTRLGRIIRSRGVYYSKDVDRILELPQRDWSEIADEMADMLTDAYKTEKGKQKLFPIQAMALAELHDFGGLLASIRVGGGKTLVSLLAPNIVEAERPLLLVPAALKKKTTLEIKEYARHWLICQTIRIESYELIGRVSGEKILEDYKPDLIIADEAHRLKNLKAAVTRRVRRYLKDAPETRCCLMSGTLTKRKLLDFHHLAQWTHADNSPLPTNWATCKDWGCALDADVPMTDRINPGALRRFAPDCQAAEGSDEELQEIRAAFGRKLAATPGVIVSKDDGIDCSLFVNAREEKPPRAIVEAFGALRQYWELPDGDSISDPPSYWRHARELALGFYYIWDPPPPIEWLEARREWHAYVRQAIKRSGNIDSELAVANAVDRGELSDGVDLLQNWREQKPSFVPVTVPRWIDDYLIEASAAWAVKENGLIWVEHRAFGQRLQEFSGLPYCAQKGIDKKSGAAIEEISGPAILSIAANSTGRNLQAWDQNLIVSPMPGGDAWEQLIGRTHRHGQKSDSVTVDFFLQCVENHECFSKAKNDARYFKDLTNFDQKLLLADIEAPDDDQIDRRPGPLWQKAH